MNIKEYYNLLYEYNIDGKLNDTTLFLLPTVLLNSHTQKAFPIEKLKKYGFINAYVDDYSPELAQFNWYQNKTDKFLYLLFAPSFDHVFISTEHTLTKFTNWIDCYNLDEEGKLVVHVFKIPTGHHEDVNLFLRGKYSEFSADLKQTYTSGIAVGAVYKQEWFKKAQERKFDIIIPEDQEYYSIIDIEKEILRFDEKEIKII